MGARSLLRGGTVLTMNDRWELRRAELLIEGDRIAALLPPGSTQGVEAEPLDCAGCVILPGFVQPRTRLSHALFRGQAEGLSATEWVGQRILLLEAGLSAVSAELSAKLGAAELLAGGTTSILDVGSSRFTEQSFKACEKLGLRATLGLGLMDRSRGTPAALRMSAAGALSEAAALSERWHGAAQGRLRYAYTPRSIASCSTELLRGAQQAASARGQLLHLPVAESSDAAQSVRDRADKSGLSFLRSLGYGGPSTSVAHGIWLSSEEQRILREDGTQLVHCPTAGLRLAAGAARVPELMAAGVNVGLAADSPAAASRLDALSEMRQAILLHRMRRGVGALSPRQALWMATRGGARVLGLEDQIGSVEVGKRADLVVMQLDGLGGAFGADTYERVVMSADRSQVREVFVDGVLRVKKGRVLGLAMKPLLRKAAEAVRAILAGVD